MSRGVAGRTSRRVASRIKEHSISTPRFQHDITLRPKRLHTTPHRAFSSHHKDSQGREGTSQSDETSSCIATYCINVPMLFGMKLQGGRQHGDSVAAQDLSWSLVPPTSPAAQKCLEVASRNCRSLPCVAWLPITHGVWMSFGGGEAGSLCAWRWTGFLSSEFVVRDYYFWNITGHQLSQ